MASHDPAGMMSDKEGTGRLARNESFFPTHARLRECRRLNSATCPEMYKFTLGFKGVVMGAGPAADELSR